MLERGTPDKTSSQCDVLGGLGQLEMHRSAHTNVVRRFCHTFMQRSQEFYVLFSMWISFLLSTTPIEKIPPPLTPHLIPSEVLCDAGVTALDLDFFLSLLEHINQEKLSKSASGQLSKHNCPQVSTLQYN